MSNNAASLTALFKYIGSVEEPSTDDAIREKVINFVRDKVMWEMADSDGPFVQLCHLTRSG